MNKIKIFLIFITIILIGLSGFSFYAYSLFQPVSFDSQTPSQQKFIIPKGQAVITIGKRLKEEGLIKHELVFRFVVKKDNLAGKIQAGTFQISPSMSVWQISQELTKGTADIWITLPEGWRREEIAESLSQQDLLDFDKKEFLELTTGMEGKLFPDTYLVPKQISTKRLADLLIETFEKKVLNGLADEIDDSGRDLTEIITMASLVEREAREYEQMRYVSGILWNRIEIEMPLQVDATLQYVKGYDKNLKQWWSQPLAADKKIDSPFNTYQNQGLPPRPISNPGLDAIKATLDPVDSDYIFYIHDRQGKMHYAKTLAEHNGNVNKYLR